MTAIACDADAPCEESATCAPSTDADQKPWDVKQDGAQDASVNDATRETVPDLATEEPSTPDGGMDSAGDAFEIDILTKDIGADEHAQSIDVYAPDTKQDDGSTDAKPGDGPTADPLIDRSSTTDGNDPDAVTDSSSPPDAGDGCILNECGGCGVLAASPGARCGLCGKYVCSPDKISVLCGNDPGYLGVRQLALGANHTCVLLTSGSVRCWGELYGQSPPTSNILSGVSAITAGNGGAYQEWGSGTQPRQPSNPKGATPNCCNSGRARIDEGK
jgi:Regulator of chromosome condensation (RCC1) repeat